ncbi:MAG: DNA gyrase inhibitor YacG [Pirellulales bacterium]
MLRCPTCGASFQADRQSRHMPFCSSRCQLVDLHKWMNHEIGIPHHASDEDEQEQEVQIESRLEYRFDENDD